MVQSYVNDTLISILETATVDDGQGGRVSLFTVQNNKFIDIKYEFEPFSEQGLGCWYALHFLPAQPRQKELGKSGMNEWTGVFQIDVCVLKSVRTLTPNYGVQDYFDSAYASIAEVMKRGVYKDRVHITGIGNSSAIDNGDYYSMPISVTWYCNLQN